MRKVTLGLLITFAAMVMVAGPKPTPTPRPSVRKNTENVSGGFKEPTCCQVWNNKGECVKWGPQSGGCGNTPRYVRTPTPAAERYLPDRKRVYREGDVEPTPGEVKATTVNGVKSNSYKEVAPTVTPTDAERLRQQQLQVRTKEAAPTVTPEPAETRNQPAGGIVLPTSKEAAPTPTANAATEHSKNTEHTVGIATKRAKNSAHATESIKEAAPTVTPEDARIRWDRDSLKGITKEGAPTTATPKPNGSKTISAGKGKMPPATGYQDGEDMTKSKGATKEVAPTTPTPGPVGSINLNSSRSNIYREGAPVTVTPTSGPVEATTIKSSKANGSYREAAPTATTTPVPERKAMKVRDLRGSNDRVRPTPTPRKK